MHNANCTHKMYTEAHTFTETDRQTERIRKNATNKRPKQLALTTYTRNAIVCYLANIRE